MGETIESFVAKLQAEGVEAGQREAEQLRAEAEREARQILESAKQQSEKIINEARDEGQKLLSRSQTDLHLAARDTILRLRQTLEDVLEKVLAYGARQKLSDPDFLGELLHELSVIYANADVERKHRIVINVHQDLRGKLLDWALREISQRAQQAGQNIDLKGTLEEAGFEYSVSDAKVEITVSSVVETLKEMVSPKLRELIDEVAREHGATAHDEQNPEQEGQ